MHPVIQAMINQKMNQVTGKELFEQAMRFNIPVSRTQSERIANRVRGKNIDLFHPDGQTKLRAILIDELGQDAASALDQKFKEMLAKYQ
ncbi:DUF2624 family protein [Sporolactobacillus vineae]|uniref:DUF2624 family protein n=1 Tax=Sporolactobacillus vineae TaxID=444463 RepID=UPI000289B60A|nr:DUF2624 family protein [Sporolactobacillus vineae]